MGDCPLRLSGHRPPRFPHGRRSTERVKTDTGEGSGTFLSNVSNKLLARAGAAPGMVAGMGKGTRAHLRAV